MVKKILRMIFIIAMVIGLASCTKSCYDYVTYSATHEYHLDELEEDVYGHYSRVTSRTPAENYDMITVYFAGRIYTLDGHVRIHYSDSEAKLIWTDTNVVHGDTLDVYAPKGSILIRQTTRLE